MTKLLLFLWFPLSVGIVHGMSVSVAAGMVLQHLLLLVFPAYAIFKGLMQGRYFFCGVSFIAISVVFIHAAIFNPQIEVVIKLLATIGVVQWAYIVSRDLTFDQFVRVLAYSSLVFFLFSLVFIIVFPDLSRQYFWGDYVLTSFYSQKNTYGRFLTLVIVFFVFGYIANKKNTMLCLVFLVFLVMLGTSSRTSLAMSLLCIAIVVAMRFKWFGFGLLQIGLAALLILLAYGVVGQKIYFIGVGSALDGIVIFGKEVWLTGRATVWSSLFYQLSYDNKWLWGYGLDRFFSDKALVYQALGDVGLGVFVPSDPHNGYIDTILSYGLIGLTLWGGLLVYLLNSERIQGLSNNRKAFAMVVVVIMLTSNISESFIIKSTNFYCFLFFYLFFMKESQDREQKTIK